MGSWERRKLDVKNLSSLLHVPVLKIFNSVCDDETKWSLGKFADVTKHGEEMVLEKMDLNHQNS